MLPRCAVRSRTIGQWWESIGREHLPGLWLLCRLRQGRRWDGIHGLLLVLLWLGWLQLRGEALELRLLRAGKPWRAVAQLRLLLLRMLRGSLQGRLRTLLLLPAQLCFKLVHGHCALQQASTVAHGRQNMHIRPEHVSTMLTCDAACLCSRGSTAMGNEHEYVRTGMREGVCCCC